VILKTTFYLHDLIPKAIASQKTSVSTKVRFLSLLKVTLLARQLTGKTGLQFLYIALPNLSQAVASETQLLV